MYTEIEPLASIAINNWLKDGRSACLTCHARKFNLFQEGLVNITGVFCNNPGKCIPKVLTISPKENQIIGREAFTSTYLPAELPVPKILRAGELYIDYQVPYQFLVKEYKPGKTLHDLFIDEQVSNYNDGTMSSLVYELGRCLARMGTIELPKFGKFTAQGIVASQDISSWLRYYESLLSKRISNISRIPAANKVGNLIAKDVQCLIPRLVDLIELHKSVLKTVTRPFFTHHDFHLYNLLGNHQGKWYISGILDLENATAGDPEVDLVSLESHLYLMGKGAEVFKNNLLSFQRGYKQLRQPSPFYPQKRILYHIPWSLSYFSAIMRMDTTIHPITDQISSNMQRHFEILSGIAGGCSLEEIGLLKMF